MNLGILLCAARQRTEGGGAAKLTDWTALVGNATNADGLTAITNETDTDEARSVAGASPCNAGYDFGASNDKDVTRWVVASPDGNVFRIGGGTVTLQRSSDGSSWTNVDSFASDESNGEMKDRTFASAGAFRYWRAEHTGGTGGNNIRFTRLNLYGV